VKVGSRPTAGRRRHLGPACPGAAKLPAPPIDLSGAPSGRAHRSAGRKRLCNNRSLAPSLWSNTGVVAGPKSLPRGSWHRPVRSCKPHGLHQNKASQLCARKAAPIGCLRPADPAIRTTDPLPSHRQMGEIDRDLIRGWHCRQRPWESVACRRQVNSPRSGQVARSRTVTQCQRTSTRQRVGIVVKLCCQVLLRECNFLPTTTIACPIAFLFMSGKGSAMY
jgi:hypothetical protein